MKAQRRLGLALSFRPLISAFLFDVVVLLLASHSPFAPRTVWWVGVGIAAVVTIAMVITYRGITVASALSRWMWDLSADIWDSSSDPEAALSPGCTPAIDHHRRFGRDVVGVREYQGQLVAAIALHSPADPSSGRHGRRTASSATVPVVDVAAALRQFDVRLGAIDIVSARTRQISEDPDSYTARTADDQPVDVTCGTWLVLRMNPQHNVAAVAARDSVASTLAAAAERLADDLDGWRCAAQPLTGDELAEVDSAVAAGLKPTSTRPGWRHLKHVDGYATSFWVSPRDITSETLDRLFLKDTDATVVTIKLTPTAGRTEVSTWVRYHSQKRLQKEVWAGLNRLTGRQLAAVHASLPAPAMRPPLVVPTRVLREDDELAVRVDPPDVSAAPPQSLDATG